MVPSSILFLKCILVWDDPIVFSHSETNDVLCITYILDFVFLYFTSYSKKYFDHEI